MRHDARRAVVGRRRLTCGDRRTGFPDYWVMLHEALRPQCRAPRLPHAVGRRCVRHGARRAVVGCWRSTCGDRRTGFPDYWVMLREALRPQCRPPRLPHAVGRRCVRHGARIAGGLFFPLLKGSTGVAPTAHPLGVIVDGEVLAGCIYPPIALAHEFFPVYTDVGGAPFFSVTIQQLLLPTPHPPPPPLP